MERKADAVTVIDNVSANGYHSAVIFEKFTASVEFAEEANRELAHYGESVTAGEHYFIRVVATFGKKYNAMRSTKYTDVFEVGKSEGNTIYKNVLRTRTINF